MFLCTANSCRSQMAEGFARELGKGSLEVFSAGLMAAGISKKAMAEMREIGIDISTQQSKEIDEKLLKTMDVVITLCEHAEASCPLTPPNIKRLHWPIRDPMGATGAEQEIMADFRRARDEIKQRVRDFLVSIIKIMQ
jgi:arsenate reductase